MQDDDLRQQLQHHLSRLDWSQGITKEMLLESLVGEPAAQGTIARGLAGGVYFSPADVLAALPGDAGRLGAVPEPPPEATRPTQAEAGARDGGLTPPESEAARPIAPGQWQDGSSDQGSERTMMAVAIAAVVIVLAGIVAWLGRRLRRH